MGNRFEKDTHIALSQCDNTGKLSVYHIFTTFMDMATDHAQELKLSSSDLGENLFWITVRTKAQIINRPAMSQKVSLSTWPQKPSRVRANRHYLISDENGVLIKGKSEWTVVDTSSGKLQRVSEVYPESFNFCEELAIEENFSRVCDDFSEAETISTYTIRSTDIDLVQHMNNAQYIRVLMGVFTKEELEEKPVKEIEIAYKAQSYEGETLTIKYRNADDCVDYGMLKSDDTVAAIIRVIR